MNKNILEKLYHAYCADIETESTALVAKNEEKLRERLDAAGCEQLERFTDALCDDYREMSQASFKQGIRASVMLMVEVFS
jgi:hypothetical protein